MLMTFPRNESDLLIFDPSLSLWSLFPVVRAHSDPAKSTILIYEVFILVAFPFVKNSYVRVMVVTVCAQDEVAFIFVAPIVLNDVPYSIYYAISS